MLEQPDASAKTPHMHPWPGLRSLGNSIGDSIPSLPKTCSKNNSRESCFIDSPFYLSNVDGMDDVWEQVKAMWNFHK